MPRGVKRNMFDDAVDTLKGIDMAEKADKKKAQRDREINVYGNIKKTCDWSNPEEVAIMYAEKYEQERSTQLDLIVPNRICPTCGRKVHLSSCWVIKGDKAWCKSCYAASSGETPDYAFSITLGLQVKCEYTINGWNLKCLRSRLGLSQAQLKRQMKRPHMSISKLEKGVSLTGMKFIRQDTFEEITLALVQLGASEVEANNIVESKRMFYRFDPWNLSKARVKLGIGVEAFADKLGWTAESQRAFESPNFANTMPGEKMIKILAFFESLGVEVVDVV